MQPLQQLIGWLSGCPLWEGQPRVDNTAPTCDSCGIFPMGQKLIWEKEDVLGNLHRRWQENFLIRRVAPRGVDAAQWLADFSAWVEQNRRSVPRLGDCQQVRTQQGRLKNSYGENQGLYEITLTLEYTKENENGEN